MVKKAKEKEIILRERTLKWIRINLVGAMTLLGANFILIIESKT